MWDAKEISSDLFALHLISFLYFFMVQQSDWANRTVGLGFYCGITDFIVNLSVFVNTWNYFSGEEVGKYTDK